MPTKDYIPGTDTELVTWLTNFKLKIPEITMRLMLPMQTADNLQQEDKSVLRFGTVGRFSCRNLLVISIYYTLQILK